MNLMMKNPDDDKKPDDDENPDDVPPPYTKKSTGGFRYSSNPTINKVTKALVFLSRL